MARGPETALTPRKRGVTGTEFGRFIARLARLGVRTMIPARVVTYNPATQKVDVVLQHVAVVTTDAGEQPRPPTVVPSCPVAFPSGTAGTAKITWPLATNDPGYLQISDRSLEVWLRDGLPGDPAANNLHNIVDGVFHPQLRSDTEPLSPAASLTAMVIEFLTINLGEGAVDQAALGTALVAAIDAAIVAAIGAGGGGGGSGAAAFTAFQNSWNAAKAGVVSSKVFIE